VGGIVAVIALVGLMGVNFARGDLARRSCSC
jgi:hypothetical protein